MKKTHPSEPYVLLFSPLFFGLFGVMVGPVTLFYISLYVITNIILLFYAIYVSQRIKKRNYSKKLIATYITVTDVVTSLLCLVPGLKANQYVWVWVFLWGVWFLTFFLFFIGPRFITLLRKQENQRLIAYIIFGISMVLLIPTGLLTGRFSGDIVAEWLGKNKSMHTTPFMISLTCSLMFLALAQVSGKKRSGAWNNADKPRKRGKASSRRQSIQK
ncbi:hypothetical protein QUF49_14445 [Fictibacillus sp. b24]|uniref:hypothetical protein n=1 Tax=Fictibacillus sp. b24 TaxID=3055863 RepID=UPI0025A1C5A4|nr:hypothetical protein [Fictibacillus sp. b24]MDM5317205.1 hypothetical protein [Fictibacillus sp. b24]